MDWCCNKIAMSFAPALAARLGSIERCLDEEFGEPAVGETLTRENLHLAAAEPLADLGRLLTEQASTIAGVPLRTDRMWGLRHIGPMPRHAPQWHNHLSLFSGVFYVSLPTEPLGIDGAFGVLSPEPVFLTPRAGLFLLFDYGLVHDAMPLVVSSGCRISVGMDFSRA